MLLLLIFCIALIGCDKERIFDEYKAVPNEWHRDSTINFNISQIDSVKNYNLFINVRNNSDFRFSNLFLIAEIQFPQGKVISDTLEYQMAEPDGTWLGTGFGDIKENKLWYKEGVQFSEPGTYEVRIKHAMREIGETEGITDLEGITDIGFRIENSSNN